MDTISKAVVIDSIPLEDQLQDETYIFKNLRYVDDDCQPRLSYSVMPSPFERCLDSEIPCYGDPTHLSPGDYYVSEGPNVYQQGLGLTDWSRRSGFIGSNGGGSSKETLVYYEKNGIPCGTQWILGTKEYIAKGALKLWPNPAQSFFYVELPNLDQQIESVAVYDLQGRTVLSQKVTKPSGNVFSIESEALTSGIYLVKASSAEAAFTQKLVVE